MEFAREVLGVDDAGVLLVPHLFENLLIFFLVLVIDDEYGLSLDFVLLTEAVLYQVLNEPLEFGTLVEPIFGHIEDQDLAFGGILSSVLVLKVDLKLSKGLADL